MAAVLLFGRPGMWELVLIGLLLLLFFGGKKIPELMKGLGKGVKSFKEGMKDESDDSDAAPFQKPEK
jgi:sec-independent protein translocase protein TatA